jgi:hypothetical protein
MLESAIVGGQLTKTMVAQDLGVSPETIFNHMQNHWKEFSQVVPQPAPVAGIQKLAYVNKHDMLMNNCQDIQLKLRGYLDSQDISATTMKTMLSLAQEVRHSITALAELEGEIKKEQNITLNFYNELKVTIFSNLCPECRTKVLAVLDKQDKALARSQKAVEELLIP